MEDTEKRRRNKGVLICFRDDEKKRLERQAEKEKTLTARLARKYVLQRLEQDTRYKESGSSE